jgi:transposase
MVKRLAPGLFDVHHNPMVAVPAPTEFQPLTTTREERGRQIAKLGGIRQLGARYVVPSQSANANVPTYLVDIVEETCTCPDFETRRQRCKHVEATYFWLAMEGAVNAETGEITLPPKEKRKTYKQDWRAYNAAQTSETERIPYLLYWLCQTIDEEERPAGKPGRKPIPRREAIYAIATKVYSLLSTRRAEGAIKTAFARGHLSRVWDHNTIIRALADEDLTEILVRLIEESSAPLAAIEGVRGQYAADSTGIGTVTYVRHFDVKHRKMKCEHPFVKLHFICGTATHVICAVKVSKRGDCPMLKEMIPMAGRLHDMKQISADKAYLAKYNLAAIVEAGAEPFIPFKDNSVGMTSKSPHWRKMWALFTLKAEEFYASYHMRSNAESVVSMVKRNFGGSVRTKVASAQVNEILCKCLLHNLTRIIHMVEEFGIEISFPTVVKA